MPLCVQYLDEIKPIAETNMKTTLYTTLLAFCGLVAVTQGAQGTVYLGNRVIVGNVVDEPIYMPDGVTPVCGTEYKASLFFENDTTPVTVITTFYDCTVVGARGYFKSVPDAEVSGTLGGETVQVQVGVWDGTGGLGYLQAAIRGMSEPFSVTLGNEVVGSQPPTFPAHLAGLESFRLVPEPSAGALSLVPCMAVVFRRRREA